MLKAKDIFFCALAPRFNVFLLYILLPFLLIIAIFFSLFLPKKNDSHFSGTYYYLDKPAPIPSISFDELIDPQLVDYVKTASIDNYNKVVNVSGDYWLYLKSAAQNSASEAKKLWVENFPY